MRQRIIFGVGVLATLAILASATSLVEMLNADEVMVIQSPVAGTLTWHTDAGLKWQGFGRVTKYRKRALFNFNSAESTVPIPIRFNDGGGADLNGRIEFRIPLDHVALTELHTQFGSQEAIAERLVKPSVVNAVKMTGPLMNSFQSYSERRNDLVSFIHDQIENGIFKTKRTDIQVDDVLSGTKKTITIVELVYGDKGQPLRQDVGQLALFGVSTATFTIAKLGYSAPVELQIQQQRELMMNVQTAVAKAREAEQEAKTAEQHGKAEAAKAKWEQEVIKAKKVTEAQQNLEVARLARRAAVETKQANILLGQGEAERKRLVFNADGALNPKLDAIVKINQAWASNMKDFKGQLVPQIQTGGNGGASANGMVTMQQMMEFITIDAAKRLGADMTIPKGRTAPKQ